MRLSWLWLRPNSHTCKWNFSCTKVYSTKKIAHTHKYINIHCAVLLKDTRQSGIYTCRSMHLPQPQKQGNVIQAVEVSGKDGRQYACSLSIHTKAKLRALLLPSANQIKVKLGEKKPRSELGTTCVNLVPVSVNRPNTNSHGHVP